jgi:hypothetical protein
MPNNSEERKRLLQSFVNLPSQEKAVVYQALEHLRWLTVLWDLEELETNALPSASEKRHILLAYKLLEIIWFDELPERNDQTFVIHVRDRLPDNQSPETINRAFDRSVRDLTDLCKGIQSPKWLKNATVVKVAIESFPQRAR